MANRRICRQDEQGDSARRSELVIDFDEQGPGVGVSSRDSSQNGQQQQRVSASERFLFIDANADRTTSGEAVRVHVMRQSHRRRREQQSIQTQCPIQTRRAPTQDQMVILDIRHPSRPASTAPPETASLDETARTTPIPSTIDWPAVLRTGVPHLWLESIAGLERLAEGYIRSIRLVQTDVLHMCRGDDLSMSAYLALAALQLASNTHEPANVASVQFEARAIELLRIRIALNETIHADTTIMAVLLLSQLEHKGNTESALFHINALQRLVQHRGGLSAVRAQSDELFRILIESGFVEVDE